MVASRIDRFTVLWLSWLVCLALVAGKPSDDDVAGPVVKIKQIEVPGPPASPPVADNNTSHTIAQIIDQALQKEFKDDTDKAENDVGKSFNETAKKNEAELATVVMIRANKDGKSEKAKEDAAEAPLADTAGPVTSSKGNSSDAKAQQQQQQQQESSSKLPSLDKSVDRIIDSRDNEFVLSYSKDNFATLTLDPLLIQDLTFVLAACAAFGMLFESVKQPVINGYLVAGALVGPGGFQLIKELVQVESLAQLGVQLLLFGLGLELSLNKLRAVWGVSIIGGLLQILLLMMLGGITAAVAHAPVPMGIFVGALLSMSSTSVVIKCLEATKSTNSAYGQITIGTLILQDCAVGVMFALMPAFAAMQMPQAAGESSAQGAVLLAVMVQVLLKLGCVLGAAIFVSRTLLPMLLRILARNASKELQQLSLVGFCLMSAWISGWLGLSEELGAFIAGAMVSMAEQHSLTFTGTSVSPEPLSHSIESIQNVLTALFVASIGLIMSPMFLFEHIAVLTFGTLVVMVLKSCLVALVVHLFGMPLRTSLAVGISMAHIGEFSFVLLSVANQLKLLSPQVYMLLLGVTAVSLLTTPMVIMVCNRLLRDLAMGDARRAAAMMSVHNRPPGSMSLGSIKGELLVGVHGRDSTYNNSRQSSGEMLIPDYNVLESGTANNGSLLVERHQKNQAGNAR